MTGTSEIIDNMPNVISVDVEDWYQSCVDFSAPISERCYESTSLCLEALDSMGVKGTFFAQGMVAEQRPEVIRAIDSAGHDIQTHGHSHLPIYDMGPEKFREDLNRAKELIEDITGKRVTGYRAPDFTIRRDTFWAFEVMSEIGITIDSSIFPMRTHRYGISGFEPGYSRLACKNGKTVEELPVTIIKKAGISFPVGGGGYFRLWPKRLLKMAFEMTRREGRPFVIYCHPYEFNPREWDNMPTGISVFYKLHQSTGRAGFVDKLKYIVGHGRFGTIHDALNYCRSRKGAHI